MLKKINDPGFAAGMVEVMDLERPVFGPGPVRWVGVVQEGNQIMATVGRDLAATLDREGILTGPLGNQGLRRGGRAPGFYVLPGEALESD
jgi:hypothetical protein